MKQHMTKAEIAKIKKQAKARKNRRLSDSEYQRLMAKVTSGLALHESSERFSDIEEGLEIKPIAPKHIVATYTPTYTPSSPTKPIKPVKCQEINLEKNINNEKNP